MRNSYFSITHTPTITVEMPEETFRLIEAALWSAADEGSARVSDEQRERIESLYYDWNMPE